MTAECCKVETKKTDANKYSLRKPEFYNKWRKFFQYLVTHIGYMIRFKLVYRLDVLGKENMPTSLSKFQDMKYNDIEKWKDLKSLYKATNNGMILQSRLDYSWNGENNFIPTGTALTSINIIAGKGSNTTLRVADSLAKEYGGQSKDWSKKVAKITSDKYVYDVHWYEYNKMQYKAKVKMRKDRKK